MSPLLTAGGTKSYVSSVFTKTMKGMKYGNFSYISVHVYKMKMKMKHFQSSLFTVTTAQQKAVSHFSVSCIPLKCMKHGMSIEISVHVHWPKKFLYTIQYLIVQKHKTIKFSFKVLNIKRVTMCN